MTFLRLYRLLGTMEYTEMAGYNADFCATAGELRSLCKDLPDDTKVRIPLYLKKGKALTKRKPRALWLEVNWKGQTQEKNQ